MCKCCESTAAKCTCSPNCKGCDCNREAVKEGLADLAGAAERDHEVQMARADLYKIAKYAIKLHEMLKNVSEEEGLEGWVQAKITKAADYIGAVYHNLDYEMKFGGDGGGAGPEMEIQVGEGKYKSDAQRKAIHANKDKKMKEDVYKSKLHAKLSEKAKSKAQQRFMGMVHAAQKGEPAASPEVAKAAKGMSKKAAKDYASTKHKGKPEHVKKD